MPLVANKSSAVLKAPIEIWKEIMNHALFDPAKFSANPFYPGCHLHSAFEEWNDVGRLRKCEVQRGLFRLVSRSWKALADSTRLQYFEPYRCQDDAQRLLQTNSARRLYLHLICSSCGRYNGGDARPCLECPAYGKRSEITKLLSQLDEKATNPRILDLPSGDWPPSSQVLRGITNAFPNLNALLISVDVNPLPSILSLVPTLTLFSLELDMYAYHDSDGDNGLHTPSQLVAQAPIFSSLKIFKIQASFQPDFEFVEDWEMPVLAHLEVIYPFSPLDESPRLITKFGINLISLHLRITDGYVFLPESIWEDMPALEYMGTTIMAPFGPWPKRPPDGHPLRTLAILEKTATNPMWNVRLKTLQLTQDWTNLTSIADLHSWDETPEDLLRDCKSGITFDHRHRSAPCPLCVGVLYTMCLGRGINYLDRTGRTFAESRGDRAP